MSIARHILARKGPSDSLCCLSASASERLQAIGIKGLDVLIVSQRKPRGFYGFPNQFVEKMAGVPATSRNWNTDTKIAALLREASAGGEARRS